MQHCFTHHQNTLSEVGVDTILLLKPSTAIHKRENCEPSTVVVQRSHDDTTSTTSGCRRAVGSSVHTPFRILPALTCMYRTAAGYPCLPHCLHCSERRLSIPRLVFRCLRHLGGPDSWFFLVCPFSRSSLPCIRHHGCCMQHTYLCCSSNTHVCLFTFDYVYLL
jgi:hypothetical protein